MQLDYVSWLKIQDDPIFGVVSLTPKDWPCNCINTPASGAAATAAFTSPIRIGKKHTHRTKMVIYKSSIS